MLARWFVWRRVVGDEGGGGCMLGLVLYLGRVVGIEGAL